MYSLPVNVTFLYLTSVTDNTQTNHNNQFKLYKNLLLLNISNSIINKRVIYNFLLFQPNLRVLMLRNTSMTDLTLNYFTRLLSLSILDLQENVIFSLTSGCFHGLVNVPLLDLHGLKIHKIEPEAFEGLLSLLVLNLSYNNLDHLYNGRFQYLVSLTVLDLRGNVFKSIQMLSFTGLQSLVFTTYARSCCYVDTLSTCYSTITRYQQIM